MGRPSSFHTLDQGDLVLKPLVQVVRAKVSYLQYLLSHPFLCQECRLEGQVLPLQGRKVARLDSNAMRRLCRKYEPVH